MARVTHMGYSISVVNVAPRFLPGQYRAHIYDNHSQGAGQTPLFPSKEEAVAAAKTLIELSADQDELYEEGIRK